MLGSLGRVGGSARAGLIRDWFSWEGLWVSLAYLPSKPIFLYLGTPLLLVLLGAGSSSFLFFLPLLSFPSSGSLGVLVYIR